MFPKPAEATSHSPQFQLSRRSPHHLEAAGAHPFHQAAEVAGGIGVVPGHHGEGHVHLVALGLLRHQGEGFHQLVHVHLGDDPAPGEPAHGPGGLAAGILARPGEGEGPHGAHPDARSNLHGANQVIEILAETLVISHGFKIQIGEMNLLEGIAGMEQKDLHALPLHPLGHAVGGRVAHFGHVGFVEQAIEPDIVHANLLGLGQLLVKRQRQFRGVHGQTETMSGRGLSSRAGGPAGSSGGPGLAGSRSH